MRTGKYWGSAEHRALITEVKKETLQFVKELTEKQIVEPNDTRKLIIDEQYAFYKRLLDYKF